MALSTRQTRSSWLMATLGALALVVVLVLAVVLTDDDTGQTQRGEQDLATVRVRAPGFPADVPSGLVATPRTPEVPADTGVVATTGRSSNAPAVGDGQESDADPQDGLIIGRVRDEWGGAAVGVEVHARLRVMDGVLVAQRRRAVSMASSTCPAL